MGPHEALGMQTPATRWCPSPRRYDARPPRWEYPAGAWVLKVDSSGKAKIKGQQWNITAALAGEQVQIVAVEERLLVFYCETLIRELEPDLQRSTIADRWRNDPSSKTAAVMDV